MPWGAFYLAGPNPLHYCWARTQPVIAAHPLTRNSKEILSSSAGPCLADPSGSPIRRQKEMDFRTYAEKESADFVERLAKASADAVAATEKRLSDEAKRAA